MNNSSAVSFCLHLALSVGAVFGGSQGKPPLQRAPSLEAARANPFDGQQEAVQAGQKLFRRECAGCHGRAAQGSRRAPALDSRRMVEAPPGAVFWVLRNGSLLSGMPSFSHLPEAQRWQIVTYLKTLR